MEDFRRLLLAVAAAEDLETRVGQHAWRAFAPVAGAVHADHLRPELLQDVRTALAYVERGEAEAGIVYSTDLLAAKNVVKVHEFDPALHDEIVYVLVLLKHGEDNQAAKGFFTFLQSKEADATLQKFGFERISGGSKNVTPKK